MLRTRLWCLIVLAGAFGVLLGSKPYPGEAREAKQELQPVTNLPLTQVVLFNSGVGYFARSGEVEGEARVDLAFQETDINDLLKSMVLQDFGGGRVSAVSYDSREPIARTLSSFAINLNNNPSLAQLLHQARGERVEVAMAPTAANQAGTLSGTIVGLEKQKLPAGTSTVDVDMLNLWCADGMRSLKLTDIQKLRFANPVIESELRRALAVLALNHDSARKAVSLHFAGEGKRKVQVGYVIEAPIWKTSYRLVLDGQGKPYLQGWAIVENPTDEDWSNVKMALVSGRPISFKMDLYNPLFVPRPTVEPELFASLRPPTYRGGFDRAANLARNLTNEDARINSELDAAVDVEKIDEQIGKNKPGAALMEIKSANRFKNDFRTPALQFAQELEKKMEMGAVSSAATAAALGDFFQYIVDHPVTLPRQKSALLPIIGKEVEGQRVSIYNAGVQARHPLLGLRFKNTTGVHLSQGPITVFEGSNYAGDSRVLDVQPNEERLISYAIDLGTEVDLRIEPGSTRNTAVHAVKGIVTTTTRTREQRTYWITNRSTTDRMLVIEHPNRSNAQFKLVDTPRPIEETPAFYRFQTSVQAGKTTILHVNEERDLGNTVTISNANDDQIRHMISLETASPKLKAMLTDALVRKARWDEERRELQQIGLDLQRLAADQDRIRKNLRETPKEADVYAVYLKKLGDQEKEIDTLTSRQKERMAREFAMKKQYEDFVAELSD